MARAHRAIARGLPALPFRELYDQHGILLGAVLVEQSEYRREDAVRVGWTPGWTLLVNTDRHRHLAWRRDAPTGARRSLLGVGVFIAIMGPDNSEIGTVGPVNLHGPGADVPLALQDAAGKTIGSVEETKWWGRFDIQRAILDANGVEVGHIETIRGTSSVIEIYPGMPELLRRFVFPLEDLFRAWETPAPGGGI
jgi:hypothetical protein